MGTFQLSSLALSSSSSSSLSLNFNYIANTHKTLKTSCYKPLSFSRSTRARKIRAISTIPDSESEDTETDEPPSVDFAFVSVS